MTVAEQPCYTLINTSQDLEPLSEMQLREDLEKGNDKVCLKIFLFNFLIKLILFFRQKLKH
jgi:coatomer subunit beta